MIKSGFIGFNTYTKKTYLYGNLILRYEGEKTALRILVTDAHRSFSHFFALGFDICTCKLRKPLIGWSFTQYVLLL